jgi:hypothetical protein
MTKGISGMPDNSQSTSDTNFNQGVTGLANLHEREKYLEYSIIIVLFAFGSYLSFIFWGHQTVPNPDFFGFIDVAEAFLSFQFASIDYRQLPGLGLLQKGISVLVGGPQAELTAGWLLNAILHPLNIVLVWLVGKKLIGQSALWVAILVGITPWVLRQMIDPIAETTFLFFILLTFYCMYRQSRLAYLIACMATVVRYEAAALILAVFFMDIIACSSKKERIRAVIYAGLAGIPLAVWALLTMIYWESQGNHYLNYFARMGTEELGEKISSLQYINMMWEMGFRPLYSVLADMIPGPVFLLTKIGIFVCFAFGTVYGLWHHRWDFLALHIFLWPYVLVHSGHSILARHGVATHWIVLIICLYGLLSGWQLLVKANRIPKMVLAISQSLFLVLAVAYLIKLGLYLERNAEISQTSMSVHYAAGITIAVLFLIHALLFKGRDLLSNLTISLLVWCLVFSSQSTLLSVMGDGKKMLEFKLLADWYLKNATPHENMVVTLGWTTGYFAEGNQNSFISYKDIKADSPADFIRQAKDMNVTYVAWDSRSGLKTMGEHYYKKWGMQNIAILETPQSVGPYEFVAQIRVNEKQFINVFRLQPHA